MNFIGNYAAVFSFHGSPGRCPSKDNKGMTPLICGASGRNAKVVRILLAAGADVDAKMDQGETALSVAANLADTEIVKLLRDYGAKEWSRLYKRS